MTNVECDLLRAGPPFAPSRKDWTHEQMEIFLRRPVVQNEERGAGLHSETDFLARSSLCAYGLTERRFTKTIRARKTATPAMAATPMIIIVGSIPPTGPVVVPLVVVVVVVPPDFTV